MRNIIISLIIIILFASNVIGQERDNDISIAERKIIQAISDSAQSDLYAAHLVAIKHLDSAVLIASVKLTVNYNYCGQKIVEIVYEYVRSELSDRLIRKIRFWRDYDLIASLGSNLEKMKNTGEHLLILGARTDSDMDAEGYIFLGKSLLEIRTELLWREKKWTDQFNDLAWKAHERNKKDTTKNPFDNR